MQNLCVKALKLLRTTTRHKKQELKSEFIWDIVEGTTETILVPVTKATEYENDEVEKT